LIKFQRNINYFLLIILLLIFLFLSKNNEYINIYDDKISIVINFNNLTKDKHLFFNEILKELNSKRNFYFIKTIDQPLSPNLSKIVENSRIKIVQSNFPDSIFLPLVLSLYGKTFPEFVLFMEAEELMNTTYPELINWINHAFIKLKFSQYDYIFGNFQIIDGKKIGCSILFSKSAIIQHLLYYTDSDTTHANPFIQLSLANKTFFGFIPLSTIKESNLENIHNKFSKSMKCPSINDTLQPSLCIMIPSFKRNYFSNSFSLFSRQTYKPKFYIIIQNDNKIHFNLSFLQSLVDEPIYHIWMQNWNSFFYLNHRFSSILPCNFVLKYDDDQWPKDYSLQRNLINKIKGKNIIIGGRSYIVNNSRCGYNPKFYKKIEKNIVDHAATPLLIRPGYLKLDARNKIFKIYGSEDIALSLNSYRLCNVSSTRMKMNLIQKQNDGNSQSKDVQIISAIKNENDNNILFYKRSTYCFLINSGYVPRLWGGFEIPSHNYINVTLAHKELY
jgi:hypothetical protein